jgi:REP element-mobilizing transposase RayT
MKSYKTYYKRNLPHYLPLGYTFFVTYRLNGSLPVEVIKRLQKEREKELKEIEGYDNLEVRKEKYLTYQSQYFGKFDKLLDNASSGPTWLKENNAAQIVKDAMHYYDKKSYDLICYTIMSNHVHQIFTPIVNRISDSTKATGGNSDPTTINNETTNPRNRVSGYNVTKILQDLKKYTAGKCNKALNRSGTFWQHESYDHVVRDSNELKRIVNYVLNNPVKAGLCEKWEDWKWSYCNFELM